MFHTCLVLHLAFLDDGVVVDGLELEEGCLHALALVARASVLEPDSDLLRLQPELGGQLHLSLALQLPLLREARLQQLHLLLR